MQRVRFIVNPNSGSGRNPKKIARWIEKIFRTTGQEIEIVYTIGPGDATRLAKETVERHFDLAVAVGGDGTINEVARGLMHTQTALGVVPAGSGNGFARNFSVPLNLREAIKLLIVPRVVTIDAGQINRHFFFNVAGTGMDAIISQNFEELGVRGPLPYFYVGAKSYLRRNLKPVKIISDNREMTFTPLMVSVANAPQYGNGAVVAPNAKPDDGFLDVCILEDMPAWKAAVKMYNLFNGTIQKIKGFHTFQVKELTIIRNSPGAIHTDGNPFEEEAVLKIQVIPAALKVAVGKAGVKK